MKSVFVPYLLYKLLFNHVVGHSEQYRPNLEPNRLGGLEIDRQFESRCLVDRQVSRLFAFQNAAGVDASQAISVVITGSVALKPASRYVLA